MESVIANPQIFKYPLVMTKLFCQSLLVLLFPIFLFAQVDGEDEVYLSGDLIEAKFKGGGLENFGAFVNEKFDYKKVTKEGTMVAAFTIDKEGNVSGIKIVQMLDTESAKEMIRVLKLCPKWEPAKRGGKPVSIEIKYPMTFTMKEKSSPLTVVPHDQTTTVNDLTEDNNLYNTAGVEKRPDFPGGLQEFYKYISKSFRVPDVKGLQGKVFVTFVVEKDGSITNIKVIKDIGHGTQEEAIRVMANSPKWIPAEQSGKKVRVLYSLPISIMSR